MPDREKVIKGLGNCTDIFKKCEDGCPYYNKIELPECNQLKKDALALLKEQEAKPMIENERGWNCPSCGLNLIGKTASGYPCNLIDLPKNEPIHFCPLCGQAVKWDA